MPTNKSEILCTVQKTRCTNRAAGEKTGETLKSGDAGPHFGLEHFAVATEDFDRDFAHLQSLGASVLDGPFTTPTGIRIAFIKAPDDVRIELMYFPPAAS